MKSNQVFSRFPFGVPTSLEWWVMISVWLSFLGYIHFRDCKNEFYFRDLLSRMRVAWFYGLGNLKKSDVLHFKPSLEGPWQISGIKWREGSLLDSPQRAGPERHRLLLC